MTTFNANYVVTEITMLIFLCGSELQSLTCHFQKHS